MTLLCDLARLIRSKNAGPFQLTFDIMFDDRETYDRVVRANVITAERVAPMFHQPVEDVSVYYCEHARAVKVSMPRPYTQGSLMDSDSHGGQQYAPLMKLEIA